MKTTSLFAKVTTLLGLFLVLLVPIRSVMGLIDERQGYQQGVIDKITQSSSGPQTIMGPVLVVPYLKVEEVKEGGATVLRSRQYNQYILPSQLSINGDLKVGQRQLGIYKAQVFNGKSRFQGQFSLSSQAMLRYPGMTAGQPYIAVGISDARGIRKVPVLRLGVRELAFAPGTRLAAAPSGVHAPLGPLSLEGLQSLPFSFELDLQGTSSMNYVPLGTSTSLMLTSNWPHPSFVGSFLPVERQVSQSGFTAQWESSWFANNLGVEFQEVMDSGSDKRLADLPQFSTSLIETVDQYQLNQRSVKYALLFIGLTFLAFFLIEVLQQVRVHLVQYALVGIALVMFYVLLLALSEHIGFDAAYLLASAACVGQIGVYLAAILGSWPRGAGLASLLAALYAVLFGLLQSEDNALLLGSLLLFGVLTLVMMLTRNLDWFAMTARMDRQSGQVAHAAKSGWAEPGADGRM